METLAKDGVPGGNFSNCIDADHVTAVGQGVAKGNFDVGVAGLQREMLVADCCRSSIFGDGYHDDGQIECVLGPI